jgi:hypothetical protein
VPDDLIPIAIRIALRNAVGGSGPYTAREIDDLFNSYRFTELTMRSMTWRRRRTEAEGFHARINFTYPDAEQRYLDLINEVLANYPEDAGEPNSPGQRLRRAVRQAGFAHGHNGRLELRDTEATAAARLDEATESLWTPERIRLFISHTSDHRFDVTGLATELNRFAFNVLSRMTSSNLRGNGKR